MLVCCIYLANLQNPITNIQYMKETLWMGSKTNGIKDGHEQLNKNQCDISKCNEGTSNTMHNSSTKSTKTSNDSGKCGSN